MWGWERGCTLTRPTSPSAHPRGTKGCCLTRDLSLLCPRGSHLPSHHQPNDRAPRPHHCDTSTPTHRPHQQLHAPLGPRCSTQVSVRGVSAPRLVQSNQPPPSPAPMAPGSAFHFEVAQAGLCTSPGPRPAACTIVWPQRKTIISTQFTVSKH